MKLVPTIALSVVLLALLAAPATALPIVNPPAKHTCSTTAGTFDGRRAAIATDGHALFAFGGIRSDGSFSSEIVLLDPSGQVPDRVVGHLSVPLASPAAVWTGSTFLVFGGFTAIFPQGGALTTNAIQSFDPVTRHTTVLPTTLPLPAGGIGAVRMGSSVYLFGGDTGASNLGNILIYDFNSQSIRTSGASLPTPRSLVAVASDGVNIEVLGGRQNTAFDTNDIVTYSPSQDTASIVGQLAQDVNGGAAAFDGTDVILYGGHVQVNGSDQGATRIVEAIAPATGIATVAPYALPGPREVFGAATIGGVTYLVGGEDGTTGTANTDSIVACDTSAGDTLQIIGPHPDANGGATCMDALAVGVHVVGACEGAWSCPLYYDAANDAASGCLPMPPRDLTWMPFVGVFALHPDGTGSGAECGDAFAGTLHIGFCAGASSCPVYYVDNVGDKGCLL